MRRAVPPELMSLKRVGPVVAVAFAFFLLVALRVGQGDGFRYYHAIQAGQLFSSPALLLPGQAPQPGVGYDGQFYFFIAQDPFLRNPATSPALDNSLRYRRILYPLLAWLLSLGQRRWLPYVLVAINVVACTAAVAACALAAARAGRSPWLALAFAVYPGLWIPLALDLTEPLQLALLGWGMLSGSALLLLLSGLAKETTAVVQGLEMLRLAARLDYRAAARHLAALVALVVWSLLVWRLVRAHESTLGGHLLDPPGAPLLEFVRLLRDPVEAVFEGAAVVICLLAIGRLSWARDRYAVAAAGYALVGLAAGVDTWADPAAYFRVIAAVPLLAFLSWVSARDRAGLLLQAVGVFCGAAVSVPLLL
jgi:hypothetical protein